MSLCHSNTQNKNQQKGETKMKVKNIMIATPEDGICVVSAINPLNSKATVINHGNTHDMLQKYGNRTVTAIAIATKSNVVSLCIEA